MIQVRCTKCDEVYHAHLEHKCVKAAPPKKRVVTKPAPKAVTTDSDRVRAWRAANRERYNETMRNYRAKLKEAKE